MVNSFIFVFATAICCSSLNILPIARYVWRSPIVNAKHTNDFYQYMRKSHTIAYQ